MVKIKVCGMRRADDIHYINRYRPDYAGFILSDGFKRTVEFDEFCKLESCLDRDIKRVGVFVNEPPENILKYYSDMLDIIQLHGDEDRSYISKLSESCSCEIWKAVRARTSAEIEAACELPVRKLVIDSYSQSAYGGTGQRVDAEIIKKSKITKPFFLAGGLSPENIMQAVDDIQPYGVDFSSSVETDGYKDEKKIKKIFEQLKKLNERGI